MVLKSNDFYRLLTTRYINIKHRVITSYMRIRFLMKNDLKIQVAFFCGTF